MKKQVIDLISRNAVPMQNTADVPEQILDLVGDARFGLIGEASHGTHEFYKNRCEITKRLIREKLFSAVAVEADFPDAYRVNRDQTRAVEPLDNVASWSHEDVPETFPAGV